MDTTNTQTSSGQSSPVDDRAQAVATVDVNRTGEGPQSDEDLLTAPLRRRSGWLNHTLRDWLLRFVAVGFFIGAWAFVTGTGMVNPNVFPEPSRVVRAGAGQITSGDLWEAIIASTRRVFTGFFLAAVVGIPLGIVLGVWQPAKAFFDPIISLLRPLPSMTWIPLTMLWFGIGETQKYAIVFMGTIIYVLLYTMESTKRTDPLLIRAAQNLGANQRDVMKEVILPASLPGILSGLKVTLAIAWSCVLSAELVAANTGLGALIWFAKDWGNLPLVLVGMAAISMTVLVIDILIGIFESRILPWERHKRVA